MSANIFFLTMTELFEYGFIVGKPTKIPFTMRHLSLVTLLIIILAATSLDILFFPTTLEDAQITFRYSLRFSEGYAYGMWNRTGAAVEGFTSALWMIYLSLFGPNLTSIIYASKITSIIFHLLAIILMYFLHIRYKSPNPPKCDPFNNGREQIASRAFLLSSIALAISIPFAWYSTTGMETIPFAFLVLTVVFLPLVTKSPILLSVASILIILVRPEGIFFALASHIYFYFRTKDSKYLILLIVSISTMAAVLVVRYRTFGYILPNSYYAKSGGLGNYLHLKLGVLYFGSYAATYYYLILPIASAFILAIKRKRIGDYNFVFVVSLGLAIFFMIIASSGGGDNLSAFPFWRHTIHVLPLLLFAAFYSALWISFRNSISISVIGLLCVVLGPLTGSIPAQQARLLREIIAESYSAFPSFYNSQEGTPMFKFIKSISRENTTIATSLAGVLPLAVDAFHIDILGLNNTLIAHNGTFDTEGPVDSKTDNTYVLSLRPDIIEGYMGALEILGGEDIEGIIHYRYKMNIEIIESPIFQNEYLVIVNAPYESFNRVLFIHDAYYKQLAEMGIYVEVISVKTTILDVP